MGEGRARDRKPGGPPAESRGPGAAAVGLLIFTLYQSLLTTGIVYGWPALILILRREGVYRGACGAGEDDCSARTVALNLVFTLGAAVNTAGGLVVGCFVDTVGPKRSIMTGLCLSIVGSVTMASADPSGRVAWPLAYVAYGMGGTFVHLSSFSLGNVFGPAKGLVVSCCVAAFGLSALTFQIAQLLYMHAGVTRQQLFMVHAALQLANLLCSAWLWPLRPLRLGDRLELSGARMQVVRREEPAPALVAGGGRAGRRPSLHEAVRSWRFLGFVVFHTAQLWFARCLMGWTQSVLEWKSAVIVAAGGEGLDVATLANIYNASDASLGLCVIPVFAWITAKFGHRVAPFLATASLSVAWLALNLVANEWAIYSVYMLNSFHRQFFWSTFFNFLVSEFPVELFGKLTGIGNFAAGLLSATQNPLLHLVLARLDGDFTALIAAQLALASLLLAGVVAGALCGRQGRVPVGVAAPPALGSEGPPSEQCAAV